MINPSTNNKPPLNNYCSQQPIISRSLYPSRPHYLFLLTWKTWEMENIINNHKVLSFACLQLEIMSTYFFQYYVISMYLQNRNTALCFYLFILRQHLNIQNTILKYKCVLSMHTETAFLTHMSLVKCSP